MIPAVRYTSLLMLPLLHGALGNAQTAAEDSSTRINEVEVHAPRLSMMSAGIKTLSFDSLTLSQHAGRSVADLLAAESPIFIKTYGLGSLATSSFRGGGANHTAVLWNGFQISSPLNGQQDLSLIPVMEDVRIQFGGGSALWGSGAVGGAVHLSGDPRLNKPLEVNVSVGAGSFSDLRQQARLSWGAARCASSLKLFHSSAENDFTFEDPYSQHKQLKRQSNARYRSAGLISENKFVLAKDQILSVNAWVQGAARQIPPTLLEEKSEARQNDLSIRTNAEWKKLGRRSTLFARGAWIRDDLRYTDEQSLLDASSGSNSLIGEFEGKINVRKNLEAHGGLHHTFTTGNTENYAVRQRQNRSAAFGSLSFELLQNRVKMSLAGRQELIDDQIIPFTYHAGIRLDVMRWLTARASHSRVFRYPTFNELYWNPGGNPLLRPENGWSQEAGMDLSIPAGQVQLNLEVTAYHRDLHDWIIWLPGASFWSPQNVAKVKTQGIETSSGVQIKAGKVLFKIAALTNYVLSVNKKSSIVDDGSIDRQLIYVPMYTAAGKVSVVVRSLVLTYRHQYTGYRFTSTDNFQFLPPYDVASLQISQRFYTRRFLIDISGQAHNLYNKNYQLIQNRPMPGINFQLGVSLTWKNLNKDVDQKK